MIVEAIGSTRIHKLRKERLKWIVCVGQLLKVHIEGFISSCPFSLEFPFRHVQVDLERKQLEDKMTVSPSLSPI